MSNARAIKTFDANYGRVGEISVLKGVCDICGEDKLCIYIDGSEGEYGGASVCKDCAVHELEDDKTQTGETKMNLDTMRAAKREAEKFLALLENAIEEQSNSSRSWAALSPKTSGALRRSSMDLTRKLADLRQNR